MTKHSDSEEIRRTLDLFPDTAAILGISRNKIYEMARTGELPIIRIGRRIVVSKRALEKYLGEV
jgi:excisionase family DNA binding protein